MFRIVIDANIWIKYARSRDIAPLLDRFVAYQFLPVVNNYLLVEIFDAVVKNGWMKEKAADQLIDFVRKISLPTAEKAVYRISPDPEDNYLFDLAVQKACLFLITDDTELLNFRLPPVPVHSSGWFLKTFALEQ